jgi:hypothetical protein
VMAAAKPRRALHALEAIAGRAGDGGLGLASLNLRLPVTCAPRAEPQAAVLYALSRSTAGRPAKHQGQQPPLHGSSQLSSPTPVQPACCPCTWCQLGSPPQPPLPRTCPACRPCACGPAWGCWARCMWRPPCRGAAPATRPASWRRAAAGRRPAHLSSSCRRTR